MGRWLPNTRVQLVLILLLGAALRVWGLGGPSLWYDECASLYQARYAVEPAALFDPTKHTEPPLNTLITAAWAGLVSLAGPADPATAASDFLLRLLPCLFGILNVALVYVVAKRLFGCPATGRAAALLFALAPFQIYYAQELRIYSAYVTLALVATGCMAAALEENRLPYWAGYVISLAALLYSHFIGAWIILALNIAFVGLLWKYRRHFWRWTVANGILMVLIAPALYRAFSLHALVQDMDASWYPNPTAKTALITVKNFFAGYSPAAWAYWPLFLLALTLCAVGLRPGKTKAEGVVLVACLTCVPVIGCAWLWGRADFSYYEHRLFLFSGVAALMGVAGGAIRLGRPGWIAYGLIILFMLPGLSDYYRGRLHPIEGHRLGVFDKVDYRGAVGALKAEWEPGDRLVIANIFSIYSLRHYFPEGDFVQVGWDSGTEAYLIRHLGNEPLLREQDLLPTIKEEAVAGATRIWYLRTYGVTFESQSFSERIQGWLDAHATKQLRYEFDGITLDCYLPNRVGN